jgi:EAL domain-containing protein (putative c-di-GMP-specific phosphodiesterase class I)
MAVEPGASLNQPGPGLATQLAEALEKEQFFLVYQPTIDLQTSAFAGVEALIRWRHPQRGVLTPDTFIDELESTDQILPVGRWALDTACAQGSVWHDRGYRFAVSLNVAKRQLSSDDFVGDVARALATSRFDPSLLVLEFTQGTLLSEADVARTRLIELRSLGVRFAVDDFEPGESVLDHLERFNIDIVKLSREFVADISSSERSASLLHGLVELSETRHVQVIAAGIEDTAQRDGARGSRISLLRPTRGGRD